MRYLIGASIAALLAAPALTGLGQVKAVIDHHRMQAPSSDMCSSGRHKGNAGRQDSTLQI